MKTAGASALVVLLGASLATNVALLIRSGLLSRNAEAPQEVNATRAPSVRAPVLLPPSSVSFVRQASPAVDCWRRVDDLTAKRVALKKEIENLATPKQQFDDAPRGAQNAPLATELRKHLQIDGRDDWVPTDVECRGLVCRVERDRDASSAPVPERFWARRNLESTVVTRSAAYFRIRDENVPAGIDVLERFIEDFRRSGAVDRCTARFHDERKLEVELSLGTDRDPFDEGPPGLSLRSVGGSLADTALGTCFVNALHDAFARASLPPIYTSAHGYRVVLPQ